MILGKKNLLVSKKKYKFGYSELLKTKSASKYPNMFPDFPRITLLNRMQTQL